jgi:hypothetical protein
MKDLMRKLLYSAVIMLVSLAPMAHAQSSAVAPRPTAVPMPEVAVPAILAVDLLSVGVLIYAFRRRVARKDQ